MFYPITITTEGCFESDDFNISLVLCELGYSLRGKRIRHNICGRPQVLRRSVKVSSGWANELFAELRDVNIPLLPSAIYDGCDGEFYSMSIGSSFGGVTYRWWNDPPEGWKLLPKITRRMINEFSKHLPK